MLFPLRDLCFRDVARVVAILARKAPPAVCGFWPPEGSGGPPPASLERVAEPSWKWPERWPVNRPDTIFTAALGRARLGGEASGLMSVQHGAPARRDTSVLKVRVRRARAAVALLAIFAAPGTFATPAADAGLPSA